MHLFDSTAEILMRLHEDAVLSITEDLELEVNGKAIYHLPKMPPDGPQVKVKRSIFGTVISVPSLYSAKYFYDRSDYTEDPWRR